MPISDKIVCALPKTKHYKTPEANASKGIRLTVVVGGVILFIAGILALCKVGSFSRLGPKFGWSAVVLGFSLTIGFASFKYVKKNEPSRTRTISGKAKPSRAPEASGAAKPDRKEPVTPLQNPFKNEAQISEVSLGNRPSTVRFAHDRVVTEATRYERHWSIEGQEVAQIGKDHSLLDKWWYTPLLWEVSEEGNNVVFFDRQNKQILVFLGKKDDEAVPIGFAIDPTCQPKAIKNGDTLVIAAGKNIRIFSCSEKRQIHCFDVEGEVTDLVVERDKLVCVYKGKQNQERDITQAFDLGEEEEQNKEFVLKVFALKDGTSIQKMQGAQFTLLGADLCERLRRRGSQWKLSLCSLETGQTLQEIKEGRFIKSISYKNLVISYITKTMEQLKGDSVYFYQSPHLHFTSKEGDVVAQEWPLPEGGQGEWRGGWRDINLKIIGDELVVCGWKMEEDEDGSEHCKLKIWRYPLNTPA